MLKIYVRNWQAPTSPTMELEFPMQENKLYEAQKELGVGIGLEKNCYVQSVQGTRGVLQILMGTCINLDEVQYLAKRMDSFDANEQNTFYAVASHEKLSEVKDLINLTFNLHCYALVTDFSDLAAIGKRYELSRRIGVSVAEAEWVDYTAVAQTLIQNEFGAITPYGVLYATGNEPHLVYNGIQFPEYICREETATIALDTIGKDGNQYTEYLYLPCWDIEIEKALHRLGVTSTDACETDLTFPYMSEELYSLFAEEFPLSNHLDAANSMARCYCGFNESDRNNFHAITRWLQPQTPEQAVVLGESYYDFLIVPNVQTAKEYGREFLTNSERYDLDPELTDYIDFEKYGNHRIRQEGGQFTDYGYVAYLGTCPEVEEILRQSQALDICLE